MSFLFNAMNRHVTTTDNGMAALEFIMDPYVDLFFKIGASRGKFKELAPIISKAAAYDLDLTIRILLYSRDIRGGLGERQIFKDAIKLLWDGGYININDAARIVKRIPELGRWDDLLALFGTPMEPLALSAIVLALQAGDGLCAKWMPREKYGPSEARTIAQALNLDMKAYRKLLVRLTSVVETQMCAGEWGDINYSHVPSVASARYQKAFGRRDTERYVKYLESLKKNDGTAKINAGAVYPHDVVKSVFFGKKEAADAQWDALPNYLEDDHSNTLVVVDTSGSMQVGVGGTTQAIHVSISLGLYLSERNSGIFKDKYITFSDKPSLVQVKGTLSQRLTQMKPIHPANTDLEATFDLILDSAVKHKIPESEMPTRLVIVSDMQFDQARGRGFDQTAQEMINNKYERAGYKMPQIVYWNVCSRSNVPVEFNKRGVALVSGFSPAVMKGVLAAKMDDFTPEAIMRSTVNIDRYNW